METKVTTLACLFLSKHNHLAVQAEIEPPVPAEYQVPAIPLGLCMPSASSAWPTKSGPSSGWSKAYCRSTRRSSRVHALFTRSTKLLIVA